MHELNAYRCRDGSYLLAPACIGLGGNERDGLLSYIGSVCPEQFGDELGAWILQTISEQDFARITPARFYSSALPGMTPSSLRSGGKHPRPHLVPGVLSHAGSKANTWPRPSAYFGK